ncbi:MAG: hypothetical protein EA352_04815 [Gemmatimonadales bacterium]|nr:MAG: hypothetical protein EA352_04815 [Gemmatimonadales bacterium]
MDSRVSFVARAMAPTMESGATWTPARTVAWYVTRTPSPRTVTGVSTSFGSSMSWVWEYTLAKSETETPFPMRMPPRSSRRTWRWTTTSSPTSRLYPKDSFTKWKALKFRPHRRKIRRARILRKRTPRWTFSPRALLSNISQSQISGLTSRYRSRSSSA